MRFQDIPVPEVYKEESWDFRFFLKWIWTCLTKIKYDTEHMYDIYDPLKCPQKLLWMLGETVGWKYDDRLPACFNRLVLLNFAKMMRLKGSISGVTFAAEVNLAQFNLISYGAGYEDENGDIVEGKDILYDRLEDTTVPVNSVYVSPYTENGFIDVVYFSSEKPIDACIEYVRPLGLYLFQHSGVRMDSRTQISIDARLTHTSEYWESLGPTHVGHYTRHDYASMQEVYDFPEDQDFSANALKVSTDQKRFDVWYRNPTYEGKKDTRIDPGYRALYSLQLCNNEHVVKALIDPHFSLGYGPQSEGETYSDEPYYIKPEGVTVINPKSYLRPPYKDKPPYNLRYDREQELSITEDVWTLNEESEDVGTSTNPNPAVNPIMKTVGDAIAINDVLFSEVDPDDRGQLDPHIDLKYKGKDTGE